VYGRATPRLLACRDRFLALGQAQHAKWYTRPRSTPQHPAKSQGNTLALAALTCHNFELRRRQYKRGPEPFTTVPSTESRFKYRIKTAPAMAAFQPLRSILLQNHHLILSSMGPSPIDKFFVMPCTASREPATAPTAG
jgi:hypothetical protein